MASYAFAMPLIQGKTQIWRKYMDELDGPRREEFSKSRQRAGLRLEQVWLQNTPQGDIVVLVWDTDNPNKAFDHLMKSKDPFDIWFRDTILIECHGVDPSKPMPPLNLRLLDYQTHPVGEKVISGSRKG